MSFSLSVKKEIASISLNKEHCMLAELAAFVRTNGSMEFGSGGIKVRFDVERIDTAKRIYAIIEKIYNFDAEILEKQDKRLGKRHTYSIKIKDTGVSKKLLNNTGVLLQD